MLLLLHLVAVVVALLALSQTKHETGSSRRPTGVAVFFTSAMVAHRTLYEARPPARYLTEFYLWMSLGGALGGLAAALIAPKSSARCSSIRCCWRSRWRAGRACSAATPCGALGGSIAGLLGARVRSGQLAAAPS